MKKNFFVSHGKAFITDGLLEEKNVPKNVNIKELLKIENNIEELEEMIGVQREKTKDVKELRDYFRNKKNQHITLELLGSQVFLCLLTSGLSLKNFVFFLILAKVLDAIYMCFTDKSRKSSIENYQKEYDLNQNQLTYLEKELELQRQQLNSLIEQPQKVASLSIEKIITLSESEELIRIKNLLKLVKIMNSQEIFVTKEEEERDFTYYDLKNSPNLMDLPKILKK